MIGSSPDWSINIGDIVQATSNRTSLIALQSVNAATGFVRPPQFFTSLLRELQSLKLNRGLMVLIDDSFYEKAAATLCDSICDGNVAIVADLGAAVGAADRLCVVRGNLSALHSTSLHHPLKPDCIDIIESLRHLPLRVSSDVFQNMTIFREWMLRESSRLVWRDSRPNECYPHCFVSISPDIEIDTRRFYSELERRGKTKVSRGSQWSVDDCNFKVAIHHVDPNVLKNGLLAISSSLDVWSSTPSNLGLSSIY
jgi:hypothetical protein